MEVPRYSRQGLTAPRPNIRISPQAPEGAFGVPTGIDTGPAQKALAQAVERERKKADDVAVLDATRELNETSLALLHDPETGALNKRGRDAFGTPEQVTEAWQKRVGEIGGRLTSEQQRVDFQREVTERTGRLREQVTRHLNEQVRVDDAETTQATLQSEQEQALSGYKYPEHVKASIKKQVEVIRGFADRNGYSKERTDEAISKAVSTTHAGIVQRFLDNDQDLDAKKYLKDHLGEIRGSDAARLEKGLAEGSTREESKRQATAILSRVKTEKEALAEANKIADTGVSDATRVRIKQYYSDQHEIEVKNRETIYLRSTQIVDKNPNVPARDLIPVSDWAQMTNEQQSALQNRAENPPNNDKQWLSLLEVPVEVLGKMSRAEFESKYWSTFDRAHRSRAEERWTAATNYLTTGRGDPNLTSVVSANQQVENSLRLSGLIDGTKSLSQMTDPHRKLFTQFEQAAAERIENYELTELKGTRKATFKERQEVINDMLTRKVFVEKSWGSDKQTISALVEIDERGDVYVAIGKIPPMKQNELRGLFSQAGKRSTTKKLERAYGLWVMGDLDALSAYIKEGK